MNTHVYSYGWKNRRRHCLNPPLSPGGRDRYGQVSANVAGAHKLIGSIWLGLPRGRPQVGLTYLTYGSFPPGFVDPDSVLLGFVGPDGLFGLFILPPIDEPPIVEPEPEGEVADGLLVKPGEVEPEVPAEGLPGAVAFPAAPGAVAAPPVLALPPIAAPLPAPPPAAPPPPPAPCA